MDQETKNNLQARFRVLTGLFIWSVLVAGGYVIWQVQANAYWTNDNSGKTNLNALTIGFLFIGIIVYFLSYIIVRAWRNLPASRKVWFWFGIISLVVGILWCSFLFWLNVQAGNIFTLPQGLLLILFWSAVILTGLLFLYSLRSFIRWLLSWRILKRCLMVFGSLVVLGLLFYAEENWRGQRAWNQYKHELEAKGEKLDFKAFIPPPVPDAQNFAMAPVIATAYDAKFDPNERLENGKHNYGNSLFEMGLIRANYFFPTNVVVGSWEKTRLTDLKPWQDYYRATALTNIWRVNDSLTNIQLTLLETNEFPTTAQPQSPAADVLLALSRYDGVLQEIQNAARRPNSRFPLNYQAENPSLITLRHLSQLKKCAEVLQLRSLAELQQGQTMKALDDVKLMMRMVDSIRSEPILLSHMVRGSLANMTLQPVWEGLSSRCWSDAELKDLIDELQKQDFVADWQFALHAERALMLAQLDYQKTHRDQAAIAFLYSTISKSFEDMARVSDRLPNMPESLGETFSAMARCIPEGFVMGLLYHLPPDGWYDQNKRTLAQICETRLFPMANPDKHLISQSCASNNVTWMESNRRWENSRPQSVLALMMLPAIGPATQRVAKIQSYTDMAFLACALERYHNLHQEYPEALAALAPSFLEKIPPDVVNGEPLHYRRTKDGRYQLYSIGWNGKDDGGVSAFNRYGSVDPKNGDWVWQYPAKP